MKKIIISSGIIAVVAISAIGGTVAYFGDVEKSTGNAFGAGTLDLKIDYQCDKGVGCGFPMRDLDGDSFFTPCDIKPGDSGEITLSFHVTNSAWGKIKLDRFHDYEYGCTSSEAKVDSSCENPGDGQGELSSNVHFTIWMDEGAIQGWQCPENQPKCSVDPTEGDNILNGPIEKPIPSAEDITAKQIIDSGGFVFPNVFNPLNSGAYYIGVKWSVPSGVGNIIQTDSFASWIILQAVQSRNNPWPPVF